ncbi:MAG: fructosamine kinase family protein [gamma proteobacterium symbiont of Bathyaustriella thionipta]|nr:fructosamine kinase family protein [gamma proteobacterium symbiont of Bathyaustriella thionipta]MCU7951193.1 fructosamine kinase family protein [gamma proteobacterium symbiont of Bathyaustriella thionipta]MCU7952370.1 fructosamine kinase family protein [gamma proteobacterium symbiont of Bathyaustriella thionipta]MCU7957702.1 fructosamine kinase family protein [gamma proteobacterium symbiont of Bathyaustriella thionipta]MCU7967974.1 fructosamine kinase family protein [gamma proteobacterium sy
MTYWQHISDHISQTLNKPFQIQQKKSIGGGSINSAYQVTGDDNQQFFIKLNNANLEFMFQVEFDSLNELSQVRTIQIPKPVCFGSVDSKSYLVLEHIAMNSDGDQQQLGYALAQMHKITASQYGWYQNNIIGSTPQSNHTQSDWLTFWREERLLPQFKMLYDKGYKNQLQTLSDKLLNHLDSLLANHNPPASLLHGDLWSGNYAFDHQGRPVIFDPALYYGDREADLAMTELFGGFSQDFYQAYNEAWPLDDAYGQRKTLYNLYHILNHANLFGTSYLSQAISMMQRLC